MGQYWTSNFTWTMLGTSSLEVSWFLWRFSTVEKWAAHSSWLGRCLYLPSQPPIESCGLWGEATRCLPITVREAQAIFNTLESLLSNSRNTRFDAFVDNKALLHSWERQVFKSSAISGILRDIFTFTMYRYLSLNLMYMPSKVNPADAPSRSLSDIVPLVLLPGIKWTQPLALTLLTWWLSRSMYNLIMIAPVVLL